MKKTSYRISVPGLSFSLRCGKTLIYHATIKALGDPEYIRFLIDTKNKRMALQVCNKKLPESFKVPQCEQDKWDFTVCGQAMLKIIWDCCGWDRDKTYRIEGNVIENHDLVEFDLRQATICNNIDDGGN